MCCLRKSILGLYGVRAYEVILFRIDLFRGFWFLYRIIVVLVGFIIVAAGAAMLIPDFCFVLFTKVAF